MHPEEREEIYVGARLAVVAIVDPGYATVERSQDRGGIKGKSGELICFCLFFFL